MCGPLPPLQSRHSMTHICSRAVKEANTPSGSMFKWFWYKSLGSAAQHTIMPLCMEGMAEREMKPKKCSLPIPDENRDVAVYNACLHSLYICSFATHKVFKRVSLSNTPTSSCCKLFCCKFLRRTTIPLVCENANEM